jgi:hypothetical protein
MHRITHATRMLFPRGKELGPITAQSPKAITHRVLADPHFTYPEKMESQGNSPAPGVEPGPSRMTGAGLNPSATQTILRYLTK